VALAAAIDRLLTDGDLCRRLATAGLEKVRAHSLEVERDCMAAVLQAASGLQPRRGAGA